jgi:hypothetical protein
LFKLFHTSALGHLQACSISAPNSSEACIAQAVKSFTYVCQPKIFNSREVHFVVSGTGGLPNHFSDLAKTSPGHRNAVVFIAKPWHLGRFKSSPWDVIVMSWDFREQPNQHIPELY